ncbi:TonB-dependent receptor [Elizabethkingia anophelis]|uniref:Outer membrane receptor for ferrienterochelin and colicins n=1 Tax=Elizabethkingia anophelis TaxID=1117645 RepID=A0A6I5UXN8_9FLAO|nr:MULTISPECIES: TonB-dependent receptor [Elizabethkingia]MCT3631870.1 TonB-dependent receptor [Elizabethkingia anophelis]MCT3635384.1 TonB-dependent receptor [Elizabethkingia anophelis]MCT3692374.1 TonB-dependent receptor [Elizabethkingia anophelis]MCT3823699.1 TonB-dependent receptor [Elizabethkingia anophelis]MCT3832105.1 TonB-dependent receptor [Elizabethkingia anophelis]
MKINFRKPMLAAVITLSTASVYYAQKTKDTLDNSKNIQEVVLTGVADIAKDRKTPVAVSTIKESQIVEKLGNQEFPEILKTTPSIYAVKGGGGFGDGTMKVRGFDTNNTAVMINGVPINGMEDGAVYWSNWLGMSDVTSAMQIQRGLGASKLAIASVGGTVNIVTRAADKKREGNVTIGVGNDGYLKTLFSYNTGKSATGWSTSFLMSRTSGSTYINGSDFEAYNYYFALGYQPNKKHDFQFTFTGAPQWHMQNFQSSIANFIKYGNGVDEPNRRYNSNWGYLNGNIMSQSINFYSKPIASINWDWKISEKSKLSTVGYASWGRGGGTGVMGNINGTNINSLPKTADGLIRFDDIARWNQGGNVADFGANNKTPGVATRTNGLTRRASINSHDWYGILTNFQHKINDNWNFSVGLDGRYYYGYHPGVLTDLWGNSKYVERDNMNIPGGYDVTLIQKPQPSANPFAKAVKDQGQIVYRNYDGEVLWGGVFGQLEYSNERISAFIQGSASEQGYRRIDNWIIDGVTIQQGQKVNRKTEMKYIFGYNAKAGINFNIDDKNNVFANIGYYSKQPLFNAVYNSPLAVANPVDKNFNSPDGRATGNQQIVNPLLTNEKIASAELGYGFRSSIFNANVNLYYTSWKDRYQRFSNLPNIPNPSGGLYNRPYANVTGIHEIHMGVEFEGSLKVTDYLMVNGMLSVGNWFYKGNPTGNLYDENGTPISFNGKNDVVLAFDKVKVSDAAQTTASLGLTIKPVKDLSIFPTWNYYNNYYGLVNFNGDYIVGNDGSISENAKKGALKYPSYNLFDLGLSYSFKLANGHKLVLTGNVYNLLDTTYISDGKSSNHIKELKDFKDDNVKGTAQQQYDNYRNNPLNFYKGLDTSNTVYFGFGRTWSASISYRF